MSETALLPRASRRFGTRSPLRYPGGKSALAGLFADILAALELDDVTYVEPYAGGVGAGLALLHEGLVADLVINDFDPAVHAFWTAATRWPDELAALVRDTPLTIDEWLSQRETYRRMDASDPLALGFAFFYLNRTNRSGVLQGGVIGGLAQTGSYLMDARFNRATLIKRLAAIGEAANRITVLDLDGRTVIQRYAPEPNTFLYIDPPYVRAGNRLYLNAFEHRDHVALARTVHENPDAHWLMTYDISAVIEKLYAGCYQRHYALNYSARHPGQAQELLIASASVADAIQHLETRT